MKTVYIMLGWFSVMLALTLRGVFDTPGQPPLALLLSLVIPLSLYAIDLSVLKGALFRDLDELAPSVAVLLQTFRVMGFFFLVDYATGTLPSGFALPAGIGDVAIGLAAPWIAFSLMKQQPGSARIAQWWNYLGVLDLVIAVTMGITHQNSVIGIFAQEVSMQPIGQYPLALIPTWVVPLALILHIHTLRKLSQKVQEPKMFAVGQNFAKNFR